MAPPISKFFERLGFPLRNVRWSWGAVNAPRTAVLLRAWADEYSFKEKTVSVLREPGQARPTDSFGLDERIVHLKGLWAGEMAGYVVIATAKDPIASPREIKDYREDKVFAIERLEQRTDGTIVAKFSEMVRLEQLAEHLGTHRAQLGTGPFPVGQRSGVSTDGYKQKIPAIRDWLIETSRAKGSVTYSEVMDRFGLTFFPLVGAMGRLGHQCRDAGEPIITSLIVDKDTGRCSQGIFDEFHIDDDGLERQRCYAFWGYQAAEAREAEPLEKTELPSHEAERTGEPEDDFSQRAKRFAQVQVRTEQPAFRAAVFTAFGGRCAISGCSVPEALEAAHRHGRSWREGHNAASDGILLRRDLHTLYDRGLLRISVDGVVSLDDCLSDHYSSLSGVMAVECADAVEAGPHEETAALAYSVMDGNFQDSLRAEVVIASPAAPAGIA
jgi:hypothetical protein